ncbi:MAG: DAK2 domain-containing protein [Clostridiales bacterium]|nr:DAK2 domain-containing protein [Clostridiales bacterium]
MITGLMFRDAVISAANNISNNRQSVDELNVFPVPDGDTGTNMSMTISNASKAMAAIADDATVADVSKAMASALLRGARGNSGVILSLIFRGFSNGMKGLENADGKDIANAFELGVNSAYKAVMKPTEGTILTVVREAAEAVKDSGETDAVEVWNKVCQAAAESLERTPELLPVLKQAGVVDAGGQGFLLILKGMQSVFADGTIIPAADAENNQSSENKEENAKAELKYIYSSSFTILKGKKPSNPARLRAYLESIGDNIKVNEEESAIKVSVDSNEPGNVIQAALKYGELTKIKVKNLRQDSDSADSEDDSEAAPTKEYGFVAVAAGDGINELFKELGVDIVVSGGQTMNPSTDDILNAIKQVPAKTVFVLPNNKNIIMAAEQTVPLSKKKVKVLQTKTIPQGISAMVAFDETLDSKTNLMNMMKGIESVGTAQVTFAARDSSMADQKIKQGQILGMENGKITVVADDMNFVAYKVTKHLSKRSTSTITILYGEDVTEQQANELKASLEAKLNNAEIMVINGGQPVYYYIISVE